MTAAGRVRTYRPADTIDLGPEGTMELTEFTDEQGATLLRIARQAVARSLGRGRVERPDEGWLYVPCASFVTLTLGSELRGCVGTLHPRTTLVEDLESNAAAAAFSDTRFPPLTDEELASTRFEVSLLSPLRPLVAAGEDELLRRLVPGRDGVVLEWQSSRGTFLPQMWDKLPDRRSFLAHLKRKSGLDEDFWAPDLKAWTFSVRSWEEHE